MSLFCDARETMHRYQSCVSELRRLFVFHGLSCGRAECFGQLAAMLVESRAFRTDVSARVRSARDAEPETISADQMLTVLALASAGEELVEGRVGVGGMSRTVGMLRMFLAGIGGWREADGVGLGVEASSLEEAGLTPQTGEEPVPSGSEIEAIDDPGSVMEVQEPQPVETHAFGGAAAVNGFEPTHAVPSATADDPVIRETRDRLELAITELKVYLDDIDRRIGRIEPRLEDITQFVHTSAEMFQRPPASASRVDASQAGWEDADSHAVTGEASATPMHQPGTSNGELTAVDRDPAAWEVDAVAEREENDAATDELAPWPESLERTRGGLPRWSPEWDPTDDIAPEGTEPEREFARPSFEATDPVLMGAPRSIASWPRRTSRKEGIGNLLKIASIVLAIVGIAGLAWSVQSLRRGGNNQAEAAQARGSSNAVPAPVAMRDRPVATELAPHVSKMPGVLLAKKEGSQPSSRTPDVSDASSKTREARNRVAGKRSELVKEPPRVEEPSISDGRDRDRELAEAPVTRTTPTADGRTPRAAGEEMTAEAATALTKPGTPLFVPSSTMKAHLISARDPVYPPDALRQHLEGTVVLNAFIAKDGTVKRMDVVNGSNAFVKSAMAAVSWRRYKPYTLAGKPVEVQTQITVNYPKQ